MKKGLITSMVVCVLAAPLMADPISVGDEVRFLNQEGTTAGGEFGLAMVGPNMPELLRTFCMQKDEHLDFNPNGFEVVGITKFVEMQHDPLDERTAYLYTKFRKGTLSNYIYTPGGDEGGAWDRVDSANALQTAIWAIEGEVPMPVGGQALAWITEATNKVSSGSWTGLHDVRVLNLAYAASRTDKAGLPAQDVLVLMPSVPAPGAALLLGLGLAAVNWMKRRVA